MSCSVYLDNYHNNVYKAGDIIEGRIACRFTSNHEIRGTEVKLCGKEYTSWSHTEIHRDEVTKRTETRRVHYHGDNTFLELRLTVCGGGNVCPGSREYPFSFALPQTLPDSFKNANGHIEYYIKAKVDIPWAPDFECRRDVTVRTPLDLNKMPNICLNPVEYEDEKMLCCCCCASGPVTMKVCLDKEAFVITETPKLKVHISNLSNESIESLEVQLVMTIIQKVTFPKLDTKSSEELIASAYESGVGAHGERTYDIALDIPACTFLPNFSLCTLFEQYVQLSVEAILPGCHEDMEIKTSISLGHIPIANTVLIDGCFQSVAAAPLPSCANPPPYDGSMRMAVDTTMPPPSMGFYVENSPHPSAPPSDNLPSAPSKPGCTDDNFEMIDNDEETSSMLALPPSYNDATRPVKMTNLK